MREIKVLIGVTVLLLVTLVYFDNRETITYATHRFINSLVDVLIAALVLLVVAGATILVIWTWNRVSVTRDRMNRQRDGAFPLREYRMRGGVRVVVDPNAMISGAGFFHPEFGWQELVPECGWDRQLQHRQLVQVTRHLQAMATGDDVLMDKYGSMSRPAKTVISNAATAKFLTGPQAHKPVTIERDEVPRTAAPQLTGVDAIKQSTADNFILGQDDSGRICAVNPRTAVHLGVVGAPGCGKTVSTGYQVAFDALRAGYQLLILDGKGGVDWKAWQQVGEWYVADAGLLPDQLAHVHQEYERRMAIAERHQVAHISRLQSEDLPPIMVIVEEYGNMRMRMKNADADRIETMIDDLSQRGRMTDIHFCFIDQYPEHWSKLMMMATKAKIIYRVGPGQGNRVGDWHAEQLPDVGVFRHNRTEYSAWHLEPVAQKLLTTAPVRNHAPIIDGTAVPVARSQGVRSQGSQAFTPEVDPPPVNATNGANGDDGPTDLQRAVWDYLDQNPDATQAQIRARFGTSKGYTSRLWHEWLNREDADEDVPALPSPGQFGDLDLNTAQGRALFEQLQRSGQVHFQGDA
ncbi:hypothetical protein GC175_17115 [bacterium]|nr:hypothetical protein [bacterium]